MKATKPTKANACCTFVINVTMLIFFCYYIFNDPDDSDCYVDCSDGECIVDDMDFEGAVNEKHRFNIVFGMGALSCLINLFYCFVSIWYFLYMQ